MASFTGTRKEFKRYIGPFLRNLVQSHTRSYKKSIGKCQECECDNTEVLEAAHIFGRNRDQLIDSLLEGIAPHNNQIEVNLIDFADRFKQEHNPVSKTIKVLCRQCHRKYDHSDPIIKPESNSPLDENLSTPKLRQPSVEICDDEGINALRSLKAKGHFSWIMLRDGCLSRLGITVATQNSFSSARSFAKRAVEKTHMSERELIDWMQSEGLIGKQEY